MKGAAGMRGIRGMYAAVALAVASASGNLAQAPKGILDRMPRFRGVGPKRHGRKRKGVSKYKPHQGAQECMRRRVQMANGILRHSSSGELTPF